MAPPPSRSPAATAATTQTELDTAAAAAPTLPTDAIFEILSRTPIKSLCRFRCASREWRSLIAGPAFLAAHKSRVGPLPLLASCDYGTDDTRLRLMDVDDGKVVREVKMDVPIYLEAFCGLNVFDGRVCLVGDGDFHNNLIDMVTGEAIFTTHKLYTTTSPFPYQRSGLHPLVGAGHAAQSGKLKAVRLIECLDAHRRLQQVCQVIEFDPTRGDDWCAWRESPSPPTDAGRPRHHCDAATVDGVVDFLTRQGDRPRHHSDAATVDGVVHFLTRQGKVIRFDLETQQWRKTVGGPPLEEGSSETRITELNGALCMVAKRRRVACIDIWRLADPDKSIWVKAYTVPTYPARSLMPLMVTPDGGKILFAGLPLTKTPSPALLLYDLRGKTWNEAMRIFGNYLAGFVLCRLHLEHFVV